MSDLTIKVESPCPFLLDRMQKGDNNYFCPSCSKTIVDFREKTEAEIISYSNKDTCGIFTLDQLKGQQQQSFIRQIVFFCFTLFSFFGFQVKPLAAQSIDTNKTKAETVVVDAGHKDNKKDIGVTKDSNKEEESIKAKRNLFFRKRKRPVIGCPSF